MENISLCVVLIFCTTLGLCQGRIEFDIYQHKISDSDLQLHRLAKRDLTVPPKIDSVVLYKFLNGEYYGEMKVGSPAKSFKVTFDTTWSNTWLPSSHCAWTEIACKLHTQYDSSQSSSYIPNGTFVKESNSQFSLWGILSTDTFHLAHIKLENQTFLEATHMSINPFLQYKSDGIIGLAYKEASKWGVTPFFYNMIQQQIIKDNVFTFYMNRDESTNKAGKVIFGGTQRTHVRNDTLTTLKVVERKFWKIQVDSIFAMKNKTSYPISDKCNAIFDSSANTIIGPPDVIQKLNYMLNAVYVPGLNRFSVKCRTYAKLPTVHFVLNGKEFVIESKYYVQRLTLENIEACFSPFVPNPDPTSKYWELGGAFMMEFYTEFDFDNNIVNIGETVF